MKVRKIGGYYYLVRRSVFDLSRFSQVEMIFDDGSVFELGDLGDLRGEYILLGERCPVTWRYVVEERVPVKVVNERTGEEMSYDEYERMSEEFRSRGRWDEGEERYVFDSLDDEIAYMRLVREWRVVYDQVRRVVELPVEVLSPVEVFRPNPYMELVGFGGLISSVEGEFLYRYERQRALREKILEECRRHGIPIDERAVLEDDFWKLKYLSYEGEGVLQFLDDRWDDQMKPVVYASEDLYRRDMERVERAIRMFVNKVRRGDVVLRRLWRLMDFAELERLAWSSCQGRRGRESLARLRSRLEEIRRLYERLLDQGVSEGSEDSVGE